MAIMDDIRLIVFTIHQHSHREVWPNIKPTCQIAKFVFKNFPLEFHSQARPAAKALLAAKEQGKYWEMMDLLFANADTLSETKFIELAGILKLDVQRFGKDFKGVSTISLWEIINENSFLNFPDYKGKSMSIIDACPTREEDRIHNSIRDLLLKMNNFLQVILLIKFHPAHN